MPPEIKIECMQKEGFCPAKCPLYQFASSVVEDTLNSIPEDLKNLPVTKFFEAPKGETFVDLTAIFESCAKADEEVEYRRHLN